VPVKRPHNSPSRRGAAQRLIAALEALTRNDARAAVTVTVAELCRVADVSRNSLYRYHAPILKSLREHQRHGPQAVHQRTRRPAERRRVENLALREDVAKLAALVDHYYRAYREVTGLLERRDRELAELRMKLAEKLALMPAPGRRVALQGVMGASRPKAGLAAAKFDATMPAFKAASKQSGLD
jgi:hypothetical protein